MESTTKKTWQDEMAEIIDQLPEDKKERVHDFLMGCLATLREESRRDDGKLMLP